MRIEYSILQKLFLLAKIIEKWSFESEDCMPIINIGILAHVDAGKTSITESILYKTGTIKEKGAVDTGNTVTDSLALEQERGITIQSSTVSTKWKSTKINLVDTPGHMDFISEVERSFNVLDGAILVVSANEGVQEQTRLIYQKLKEHSIPTIIFINKVDMPFIDLEEVETEIKELLGAPIILCDGKCEMEEKNEIVIENSNILLEKFLNDEVITKEEYNLEFFDMVAFGELVPCFKGSAITSSGIQELMDAMIDCFKPRNLDGCFTGYVYKVNYDENQRKRSFIRVFGSGIKYGDTVILNRNQKKIKIKSMSIFEEGQEIKVDSVNGNDVFLITDNHDLRIGDTIGKDRESLKSTLDIIPTIKTAIHPKDSSKRSRLLDALRILTEEDPTLFYRIDKETSDIIVMLYGEVQKQVLNSYLLERFRIIVSFGSTQSILKERLKTKTSARIYMEVAPNPYWATIGIRCEPLDCGVGNKFESEVSVGFLTKSFQSAIWEGIDRAIKIGLYGWELIDTKITLEFAEFASPVSTPSDFRKLAPYVLWKALESVGTEIQEPYVSFEIFIPQTLTGRVMSELQKNNVTIKHLEISGNEHCIKGCMPERLSKEIHPEIISITNGKGLMISKLSGYDKLSKSINKYEYTYDSNDLLRILFKKGK